MPIKKKGMGKPMKKAEEGTELRKGQYKRIGRIAERNPERAERVAERMNTRATREERGKAIANPQEKMRMDVNKMQEALRSNATKSAMKKGGVVKKAKSGGSFPDLNKDGKVTKADVLKGRGVIAKKGASVKKCKYGCK